MIESVGIIGAGTMGNGIAQISAAAGLSVTMVDISDAAVKRGLSTIDGSLDRLVKKEKMSAADRDAALGGSPRPPTGRSSRTATSSSRPQPRTRS